MALKLNPFHQLLWRTPTTLQIGVGSSARIIADITPAQERLIDALYYGLPTASLAAIAKQSQLPQGEANDLVRRLGPLLLSETDADTGAESPRQLAEQIRASLDNHTDATAVLARRAKASVHIEHMDATGLTLTLALAAAGVGTITSADSQRVGQSEIASNVFPHALLGRNRLTAAKLILDSSWPGTRMLNDAQHAGFLARSTLAVLCHQQVTEPSTVALWRTRDIPVLEIRYLSDGAEVSPVLSTKTGVGCLVCRDHHRQDLDPNHLAVSSQQLGSALRFDDGGTRLVATGLAVQQALAFIDGAEPTGIGYRYTRPAGQQPEAGATDAHAGWLSDPTVSEQKWLAHPLCGCQISLSFAEAS